MNTLGLRFRLSTFGESHGVAIGGVIDGMPAGVKIDLEFLASEMAKRKPGGKYATPRKEDDEVEVLSGVFEGFSTGTPIGFVVRNKSQHSKDYDNLRDLFRPGHADYTYWLKYGVRDHRGGGRASARETAMRVAGGAFAQMLLSEFGVSVESGIMNVGEIFGEPSKFDFEHADGSEIFALDRDAEEAQKALISQVREAGESVGASVLTRALGLPAGLGEPLYHKLDGVLGGALMGLNGVKAVEIGEGVNAARLRGSQNNDFMRSNLNRAVFSSNHAGGVLGGISTGEPLLIKTHFKPTPSIFADQPTIDKSGAEVVCALRGRHDPCIGVRGSVVCTALTRLVLADMLLLGAASNISNLKKIYGSQGVQI